MAFIIDGKRISTEIKDELRQKVADTVANLHKMYGTAPKSQENQ